MAAQTLKQQTQELFDNYNNVNQGTVDQLVDYWFSSSPTSGVVRYNDQGNVNIGNASPTNQRKLRVGQDTAFIDIGSFTGGGAVAALYFNAVTPAADNYTLAVDGAGGTAIRSKLGELSITAFNTLRLFCTTGDSNVYAGTKNLFGPTASTSGAINNFSVTTPANTTQTASTAIRGVFFDSGSRQWATGAIAAPQKEFEISAPSYSFVGASTITDAYTFFVSKPAVGANATITNSWAAGFSGNVQVNGAAFFGGTLAPTAFVDVAAGTSGAASFRLQTSVAPTGGALNDGCIWQDGTNVKIRIGGATKTFTIV